MVAYAAGTYQEDIRKKESISNLSYFLAVSTIATIDYAFYAGFISKGEKCNPFNSNR